MTRDDYYPATVRLRHGKFRGEVRNAFSCSLVRCSHEHRTRSAARVCAEKLFAERLFANLEVVEGEE